MPAPPKVASIHFAISSLKPPVAIKDLGTGTISWMNLQRLDRDKPAGKKSPVCSCGKIRMVMRRDVPFSPPAPRVCREFRCYRMLVYDSSMHLSGKVIGAGEFSTSEEALARLWREKIASVPHSHPAGAHDPVWVKTITGILAAHGYRGDAVE